MAINHFLEPVEERLPLLAKRIERADLFWESVDELIRAPVTITDENDVGTASNLDQVSHVLLLQTVKAVRVLEQQFGVGEIGCTLPMLLECARRFIDAVIPTNVEEWHELFALDEASQATLETLHQRTDHHIQPSVERGYVKFDIRRLDETDFRLALAYRVSWMCELAFAIRDLPPAGQVHTFATGNQLRVPEKQTVNFVHVAIWLYQSTVWKGMPKRSDDESVFQALCSPPPFGPNVGRRVKTSH